jgi:hypothetical protein
VMAVLLDVVGPAGQTTTNNTAIWLVDSFESMMMHGLANPKSSLWFVCSCNTLVRHPPECPVCQRSGPQLKSCELSFSERFLMREDVQ